MASTAKRSFSGLLAVVFSVFATLSPINATAAASSALLAIPGLSNGTFRSATATVANQSVFAQYTTNVAGRVLTGSAVMPLAANAASFAVSAIRMTPASLVTGAVASWLLTAGLSYVAGQMLKTGQDYKFCYWNDASVCGASYQEAADAYFNKYNAANKSKPRKYCAQGTYDTNCGAVTQASPSVSVFYDVYGNGSYWAGPQAMNRVATQPQQAPAVESDYAPLAAAPLPDPVAEQLIRSVALPVQAPQIQPVDAPVSEPRIDPVTGRKVQDFVRLTPGTPTADQINNGVIPAQGEKFTKDVDTTAGEPAPVEKPQEFPDDYNREATQAEILKAQQEALKVIRGDEAPEPNEWESDVQQKKDEMEQRIKQEIDKIPGEFSGSKGNWFSWVWTPPIGACSPITGSIHGQTVNWNICPTVEKIREIIGWLMAVGGAWMIYNEMFRREEA